MTYTAPSFKKLIQALPCQGFSLPVFRRSPFKQRGRWVCEVQP